jgi:FAD:protein FMN transferase
MSTKRDEQGGMSRRAIAGWIVLCVGLVVGGCVSAGGEGLRRFEFSRPEMGMPFRMVLYAEDELKAMEAAQAAFGRVRELNAIFTDYDSDSELSLLSRSSGEGRAVVVSEDLWRVLRRSQDLAERTGGAFDVTVGPFVNAWRKARRDVALPPPERLARVREAVGYWNVLLDGRRRAVELRVAGMRLDLGGIAKGYAIDEALRVLRRHGIRRALVGSGGDMAVGDAPPGRAGWRVEVAPLDVEGAPPRKEVILVNRAIATSGDVFQRVAIDGRRYSHIVDPRTGLGLTDHGLVTVIARDCVTADSLATAVSVLGPEKGMSLLEATRGVEGQIVRRPEQAVEVVETGGFDRYVE